MFLRFSVENHLSIRDRCEFSMVATKLNDFSEGLLNVPNSTLKAVPSSILYGPNASGKSNLISAFNQMRSIVVNSHANAMPDSTFQFYPFGLDEALTKKPTTFEMDFVLNEVRYNYGFEFTENCIVKEWLYGFPNGRAQMLYNRQDQSFSFGRNLRGRNQVISELTRKNSLFLSAAAQNDHGELTPIYKYFKDMIINRSIAVEGSAASHRLGKRTIDRRVISFLQNIGTGVVGFRLKEEEVTDSIRQLQADMVSAIQKLVGKEMPPTTQSEIFGDKDISLELAHRAIDGTEVYFDLDRESSGTRRLLVLLTLMFEILDVGGLLIVDEIDASLHTHASELLLALFSSKEYNKNSAQLIATTHDTNLLGSTFMRRDQVWFCEKSDDGSSAIYPLSDIQLRNTDNFERGYLQGRFGALPISGSVEKLISRGAITSE